MSRLQIEASPKKQCVIVDGDIFSRGYAINYIELVKSCIADGDYFFLTCGCGEPGCAGLFEPIKVTSDQTKIYWHVIEPEPERWITFTKSEYHKEIKNAIQKILSLGKRSSNQIGYYGFDRERLREFENKF